MKFTIIFSVALLAFIAFASPFAAHAANPFNLSIWDQSDNGGYPVTCNVPQTTTLPNGEKIPVVCSFCDMVKVAANLAIVLRNLAASIAVLMIIYGAVLMLVSAGNEERFKSGKSVMTSAIIGVVIALAAWLVVNEVILIISGSTPLPWNPITCS